jgi:parvulin-like peptidyl-prolyl isomerase
MRSKTSKFGYCVLLAAMLLMFTGGLARADLIDGIVAVVDNSIIMSSDLHRKMVELGAPDDSMRTRKQVLELMVEDIVIKKIYDSMGLPSVNETEARKYAESQKISFENAKNLIMKGTLMDLMVRSRVVVTDKMVKDYYDGHTEYAGKESVRLRQIIISSNAAKVQKVSDELKSGRSFEEVAKEYSDVLASGKSDIGWTPIEDLSDTMRDRIESGKAGEIIGPVPVGEGGQAFYQVVEKGVTGNKTLEEARQEIMGILVRKYQEEAFTHWLQKMMSAYFIGIYI